MEQYNILIVEDDKEIRDGIEIFLKSQNYNVYKAADGIEGLEIIESKETHNPPKRYFLSKNRIPRLKSNPKRLGRVFLFRIALT